jgi:hypothetical protein
LKKFYRKKVKEGIFKASNKTIHEQKNPKVVKMFVKELDPKPDLEPLFGIKAPRSRIRGPEPKAIFTASQHCQKHLGTGTLRNCKNE